MLLNILGTEYELIVANERDYPYMKECDGYTDTSVKKLYVKDFTECQKEESSLKDLNAYAHKVAMHEIVHAFLYESGLSVNSDWATNEELIDWIAIQLPKLSKLMVDIKDVYLMSGDKNNGVETIQSETT